MNKKRIGDGGRDRRSGSPRRAQTNKSQNRPARATRPRPPKDTDAGFRVVERKPEPPQPNAEQPFRVLIAVHRPRFRGRTERAAALVGWDVTALLNKQDVVGAVAKPPRPPDLLLLSGDFGRQKDYAIFRAVQQWRSKGMKLIGLVDDCATAPEGFPDSVPSQLCDVCLEPPYKTADLRALFIRLYEEIRGRPAPPPRRAGAEAEEDDDEE